MDVRKNKVKKAFTQISFDNGLRKLKKLGLCGTGFLIMIEMPSDMKGLLKSITRSRSEVMVIDAIAMSASRLMSSPTMPSQPPATFAFSEPYFPSLTIRSSSLQKFRENRKEKSN